MKDTEDIENIKATESKLDAENYEPGHTILSIHITAHWPQQSWAAKELTEDMTMT